MSLFSKGKGKKDKSHSKVINIALSRDNGEYQSESFFASFKQIFELGKRLFKKDGEFASKQEVRKKFRKQYLWVIVLLAVFCGFLWFVSTIIV